MTITTFGSTQYVWQANGVNSYPDPENPPAKSTVTAGPGTTFTLPKASITVLRGQVGTGK